MNSNVVLSIRGRQTYLGHEPEVIELVTDGILERCDDGWELRYEESSLTGLDGVTTTFRIEPKRVTLTRTGKLNSQMVFEEGTVHESLYQVEFGALMISVCATQVKWDLTEQGGTIDLVYAIEIEQSAAGTIDYHLQINSKDPQ